MFEVVAKQRHSPEELHAMLLEWVAALGVLAVVSVVVWVLFLGGPGP